MVFRKLALISAILATSALGFSQAAHASGQNFTFSFTSNGTYSGGYNNITGQTVDATGTLFTMANGDGTYTATGGSVTVTGFDAGTYSLIPNPNAPGYSYTGGNYPFSYDNQLAPSSTPALNANGLAYGNSSFAINFYYNYGSYAFYDSNNNQVNGSFKFAAVPELSSMLGFGSFVVLGGLVLLRRRTLAHNAA